MAKYRRKPTIIEAIQWTGDETELPPGVFIDQLGRAYVVTIHDQHAYLATGDWIMPEPDGKHHYPCKPDIFANTYEPVD